VPLVLSGHSHNYERLVVDGVTYVVTGGGSSQLYPALNIDPLSQAFSVRSHFVLLEFYEDQIKILAIDKNGKFWIKLKFLCHKTMLRLGASTGRAYNLHYYH